MPICRGSTVPLPRSLSPEVELHAARTLSPPSLCLQVGLVRFRGCVLGDNGGLADEGEEQDGGRPLLATLSEEVGAQAEVVWTVDDRSRWGMARSDA